MLYGTESVEMLLGGWGLTLREKRIEYVMMKRFAI